MYLHIHCPLTTGLTQLSINPSQVRSLSPRPNLKITHRTFCLALCLCCCTRARYWAREQRNSSTNEGLSDVTTLERRLAYIRLSRLRLHGNAICPRMQSADLRLGSRYLYITLCMRESKSRSNARIKRASICLRAAIAAIRDLPIRAAAHVVQRPCPLTTGGYLVRAL